MIKIAVLMSTYNGEKYLKEQINSILNQKGNFELQLIVRDDGSSDCTCEILNEYKNKGKLEWYGGENLKSAKSFIDLLYTHLGFDYYAFSDQDDYWSEDKISIGINAISNVEKPCLYFSNAEYVDKNLKSLGGLTYKHHMYLDFYSVIMAPGFLGCTFIFNRALATIVQNNSIPQVVSMHDSFLARLCVSFDGAIVYDDNPHIKYRQHGSNVIGSTINKKNAIERRINTITKPLPITADRQIQEIIRIYGNLIALDKLKWLNLVANYRHGLNRFHLAFSNKPRYISWNMKIVTMLTILLRNY